MRIKLLLIIPGIIFLVLEIMGWSLPVKFQLVIFLAGLLTLGIPHGAVDVLVADHVGRKETGRFKMLNFLITYLGRVVMFGLLLWFLPWLGLCLFLLISAFHFGETDLSGYELSGWIGKIFTTSYGMMLLSILLLSHLDEVYPLLMFMDGSENLSIWIAQLERLRPLLLSVLFAVMISIALLVHRRHPGFFQLWIRHEAMIFPIMLLLLWRLPLLLGFTFYFIGWHSVISLHSIMRYLVAKNGVSVAQVWKQMLLYSGLAIGGTILVGASGYMFTEVNAVVWYAFMALAVLTGPHMEVMHNMYAALRRK
jgi:Brp/Blh family beta-carotene 15,15'-monooxygenase